MPRNCTICEHPQREKIESLIVNGNTFRNIAERFSLSLGAIHRHKSDHISKTLAKAKEAEQIANADNLLDEMRSLQGKTLSILARAEKCKDLKIALNAIREARGNFELLAKLQGELNDNPQINILLASEWVELRSFIIEALEPYPESRRAVSRALEAFTNGNPS